MLLLIWLMPSSVLVLIRLSRINLLSPGRGSNTRPRFCPKGTFIVPLVSITDYWDLSQITRSPVLFVFLGSLETIWNCEVPVSVSALYREKNIVSLQSPIQAFMPPINRKKRHLDSLAIRRILYFLYPSIGLRLGGKAA